MAVASSSAALAFQSPPRAAAAPAGMPELSAEVRGHDRYQLELKHDYSLTLGRSASYEITTYIFIPQSLGISESTYPADEFYRRTHNYVRLSAAPRPLCHLVTVGSSGLRAIETAIKSSDVSPELITGRLKLLCNVFRKALALEMRRYDVTSSTESVILIRELLGNLDEFLDRYRSLGSAVAARSGEAAKAHRLVAERISLLAENALLETYALATRRRLDASTQEALRGAIERESSYRAKLNPILVLSPKGSNEAYLSRDSFLKKYAESALYLAAKRKTDGIALEHAVYAVAAGVAMIFATGIAFYFQSVFGAFSLPLFAALVIGYMLKDRIKEIGRFNLGKLLRRRISDHRTAIRTTDDGRELGLIREAVRFVGPDEIPDSVTQARREPAATQGGMTLRYTKRVELGGEVFESAFGAESDIQGVTEILRYDMRPYLYRMDDPKETRLFLEGDRVRRVRCRKAYEVELVTVFRRIDQVGPEQIASAMVTLDRKGIRRVSAPQP